MHRRTFYIHPVTGKRYHQQSLRKKGYDYRSAGLYFVTFVTQNRKSFLGHILNARQVALSPAGVIVSEEWRRIAVVRPYVTLDAWIILPNHFHGLIRITDSNPHSHPNAPSQRDGSTMPRLLSGSLGAIVGQFKSRCTRRIRKTVRPDFGWQRGYYDVIVQDDRALRNIRRYIKHNVRRHHEESR